MPTIRDPKTARTTIRTLNHRRKLRRIPRYKFSRTRELAYRDAVRKIFRAFAQSTVDRVLGAHFDAPSKGWSKERINKLAEKIAFKFDDHSKKQTRKMVLASTGVDVELDIPDIGKTLRAWAKENADLITDASERFKSKLSRAVAEGVESGEKLSVIRERIKSEYTVGPAFAQSERQVDNIIRDQVGKLQSDLQAERWRLLGVDAYYWRTQNDDRVRASHAEREGERFEDRAIKPQLRKLGLKIDKLDGHPGEPPLCRCVREPDLQSMVDQVEAQSKAEAKERAKSGVVSETDSLLSTIEDRHAPLRLTRGQVDVNGHPTGSTKDVLDSVAVFTSGNVASVRDPSKFDADLSGLVAGTRFVGPDGKHRVHTIEETTKADYERAHRVLSRLARAPVDEKQPERFRGMALESEHVEDLNPGDTFDLSAISSWTSARDVAEAFATEDPTVVERRAGEREPVLFRLIAKRGRDITNLSAYRGEDEFITGGKVKIVSRKLVDGVWHVKVKQ